MRRGTKFIDFYPPKIYPKIMVLESILFFSQDPFVIGFFPPSFRQKKKRERDLWIALIISAGKDIVEKPQPCPNQNAAIKQ